MTERTDTPTDISGHRRVRGMEVVKIKNEHAEGEAGRAVLSKPGIDLK